MKELWDFFHNRLKRTRTINSLSGKKKKTLDLCLDEFVTRDLGGAVLFLLPLKIHVTHLYTKTLSYDSLHYAR
jgi:hypothetical protein